MKNLLFIVLVLLSFQIHSESCNVYFKPTSTDKTNLMTLVKKDFKSNKKIVSLFREINNQEAKVFLEVIGNYEYPAFSAALDALSKNTDHFDRLGGFNKNIFLREVTQPGSALKRFERNSVWESKVNKQSYRVPEFKPGTNVTKFETDVRESLVQMRDFLDDPKKVYAEMQDFEDEVMIECMKADPQYFSKSIEDQYKIREKAMTDLMGSLEAKHGFVSTKPDTYEALVLEKKGYSLEQWFEMLQKGHAFNDAGFLASTSNPAQYLASNREGHGYFTHRIQWYLVMKDMDKDPKKYRNIKGVEAFKMLGDMDFNKKMGVANSSGDTLWQDLFDSFSGSYHQPETFKQYHGDYPDFGAWL